MDTIKLITTFVPDVTTLVKPVPEVNSIIVLNVQKISTTITVNAYQFVQSDYGKIQELTI
jgi:hypothetical protein